MKPAENKVHVLRPCQWQWQSFEGQGRADLWTLVLWIDIGKARAAITFPNLGSASGTPNKNDFPSSLPRFFPGKCQRYPKIMKKHRQTAKQRLCLQIPRSNTRIEEDPPTLVDRVRYVWMGQRSAASPTQLRALPMVASDATNMC